MAMEKLYVSLARTLEARLNCMRNNNREWFDKHTDTLKSTVRKHMPSGSGFDNGTHLDLDASTGEKLVFQTAFHHMDEGGSYDGWSEHVVTVTPSLAHGINVKVSGQDRNDVKSYIGETFHGCLTDDIK